MTLERSVKEREQLNKKNEKRMEWKIENAKRRHRRMREWVRVNGMRVEDVQIRKADDSGWRRPTSIAKSNN